MKPYYVLILIVLLATVTLAAPANAQSYGNWTLQENVDYTTDQFYIVASGLVALFSVATIIGLIRLMSKSLR